MTIEEMSGNYSIELEKLQFFADNGLIETNADYGSEDLRRIGTMSRLYDMGFDADDIKRLFPRDGGENTGECLAILKHRRRKILDNIHLEQKMLDDIDYMVLKTEGAV